MEDRQRLDHLVQVVDPDDALLTHDRVDDAEGIAREAMAIAADICVYTNGNLTIETLGG